MQQHSFFEISPSFEDSAPGSSASWFEEITDALGFASGPGWPDEFGRRLRQRIVEQGRAPIRTLSLFSGGGGLDIAFHDAGFQIIEMVEVEKRYVLTLEENAQPGTLLEGGKAVCVDIRDYFPHFETPIDFVIGGPPCQTFSAGGRRAGGVAGTSDPRGTLFEEYVRLLRDLQPKGFLFENVYGITGAQNGEAWREIQDAFRSAGYRIHYRILDSADYGVPQHRERLFIVGIHEESAEEFLFPFPTHGPDSPGKQAFYTAGEAVAGADSTGVSPGLGGQYGHLLDNIPPGLNYSFYTEEMGHPSPVFSWRSKFSDFLYKADPAAPTRTIKAQGGQYTGPFSWENRPFSIAELKRLQTFPDRYVIVGNRQVQIEQIGNSVPPQIGRMLALSVLNQVFSADMPFQMRYMPPHMKLGFRRRKRQMTRVYAEKAKDALRRSRGNNRITVNGDLPNSAERLERYLSAEFSWTTDQTPGSSRVYTSRTFSESRWVIKVCKRTDCKEAERVRVTVRPADARGWILPVEEVELFACELEETTFTALWKAFEEALVARTGIADLVQLSGYYQYRPRLKSEMSFAEDLEASPFWRVLRLITEGVGVRQQLSADTLSMILGIESRELPQFLERLREMGYEIRNYNTNPQIQEGDYLIPYPFPTLTPKSVQLRKSLRSEK